MSHSKMFKVLTIKINPNDSKSDTPALIDDFIEEMDLTESELERQLLLFRCFAALELEAAR